MDPKQQSSSTERRTYRKDLILPIVLMAWPAAAIVVAVVTYSVLGLDHYNPLEGEVFSSSRFMSAMLMVVFLVGGIAALLGPISFIVGLSILIKRKSNR